MSVFFRAFLSLLATCGVLAQVWGAGLVEVLGILQPEAVAAETAPQPLPANVTPIKKYQEQETPPWGGVTLTDQSQMVHIKMNGQEDVFLVLHHEQEPVLVSRDGYVLTLEPPGTSESSDGIRAVLRGEEGPHDDAS